MTVLAARTELGPVQVRVTVGAFAAHLLEDERDVTLTAIDSLVEPAQRVSSLVMVKVERSPKRGPADRGMAVAARKLCPVWVSRATSERIVL